MLSVGVNFLHCVGARFTSACSYCAGDTLMQQ